MKIRNTLCTLGVLAAFAAMAGNAKAVVVNGPVPDIFSDQTSITYTVTGNTGHFTATGVAEHLKTIATDGSLTPNITSGLFTVNGTFTLSGNSITGISGNATVGGNAQTYFHSTSLTAFTNASDTFTFSFGSGDGVYSSPFQIVLHGQGSTSFSNFGTAFSNSLPIANSDTYSVPEPASLGVLGLGGMLLLRRKKARA
jgi:hypothetical protein